MIDKTMRVEDELRDINRSLSSLYSCYPDFVDETTIKFKKKVLDELNKVTHNIESVRSTCEHDWKWACSGHNDDAYECTICGEVEWR